MRGASAPAELAVGFAGHAFDHLGGIGEQAEAAAASGANIIYVTGVGGLGYQGLPAPGELEKQIQRTKAYLHGAKQKGIRLAIGYVCATSMVRLEQFDKNWTPEFRARFQMSPAHWRQEDAAGQPLPSWYGSDYQPACMNHPDWRAYEKALVAKQLEAGCDGVFFDNPTVHPQGCYCRYCLQGFEVYLVRQGVKRKGMNEVSELRGLPKEHPEEFLRYRGTIARDFLAEMRRFARTLNPRALVTANNSLNSPEVLYSQCRSFGYNIYEMSQAEDFVVVEDMSSQPRLLPDGRFAEYGPTYKQLQAICHGRPIVAVTIADGDYHTPPNLVRLAMAEAAAHSASYLSWPTWPVQERHRMIGSIRLESDFLRANASLFEKVHPRADAVVFLPFRNWVKDTECKASRIAAELSRANVQFKVFDEDDFRLEGCKVLLASSSSDFTKAERERVDKFVARGGKLVLCDLTNWLAKVQTHIGTPSIQLEGPTGVRAVVGEQPGKTIVHLLNLNVQKISSFEDKVTPVKDLKVTVRVPFRKVRSVRLLTADEGASEGEVKFERVESNGLITVVVTMPRLEIASILVMR